MGGSRPPDPPGLGGCRPPAPPHLRGILPLPLYVLGYFPLVFGFAFYPPGPIENLWFSSAFQLTKISPCKPGCQGGRKFSGGGGVQGAGERGSNGETGGAHTPAYWAHPQTTPQPTPHISSHCVVFRYLALL